FMLAGVVKLAGPEISGMGHASFSICVIPDHKPQPPGAIGGDLVRIGDVAGLAQSDHLLLQRKSFCSIKALNLGFVVTSPVVDIHTHDIDISVARIPAGALAVPHPDQVT